MNKQLVPPPNIAHTREEKQVETLIAFRDTAFWWIGAWTLFTLLDWIILSIARKIRGNRREKPHDAV